MRGDQTAFATCKAPADLSNEPFQGPPLRWIRGAAGQGDPLACVGGKLMPWQPVPPLMPNCSDLLPDDQTATRPPRSKGSQERWVKATPMSCEPQPPLFFSYGEWLLLHLSTHPFLSGMACCIERSIHAWYLLGWRQNALRIGVVLVQRIMRLLLDHFYLIRQQRPSIISVFQQALEAS